MITAGSSSASSSCCCSTHRIYNRLVRLRALVKEGFSGITVQLRRRADLIPNLVETVRAMRPTSARCSSRSPPARRASSAGGVEATAQADAQMTGLLGRLIRGRRGLSRAQGQHQFPPAAGQLASIEGELQGARRYYNATVRDLNTIQSFPRC
jgi:LemA protein